MGSHTQRAVIVYGILMTILCFFITQTQFIWIVSLYGLAFILFLYAGFQDPIGKIWSFRFNLLVKLILLFAFPLGSDDIYRFFWDGQLFIQGQSVYQYKPSEIVGQSMQSFNAVYEQMNSKDYYSVYPPVIQVLFGFCAWLSFKSVIVFSILWKLLLLLADQLTIKYLTRLMAHAPNRVYWYMWNPLVFFEVFGNGHPEGLMIFFLVMSFYFLQLKKLNSSAFTLAIGAGIKLLPVLLLPFFMKYLGINKFIKYSLINVLFFLLFLFPIWPYQQHFFQSFQLYFKSFEFNGSIYEIWKALDYLRLGYNNIGEIGRWMAGVFIFLVIFIVVVQKKFEFQSLIKSGFWAWVSYLLLSTTVHPWYSLPVLLLGLMSGYFFPVIWSGVIVLSYSWYDAGLPIDLKYLFIGIEYLVVFFAFTYEFRTMFQTRFQDPR